MFANNTHGKDNTQFSFDPVTAQFVRINILQSSDGQTLWEFQLMEK